MGEAVGKATTRRGHGNPAMQDLAEKHVRLLPNCLVWLGVAHPIAGRMEEAAAAANDALGRAGACRHQGDEAYAHWGLGEMAATHQFFDKPSAETRYHESLALAGGLGMRPHVAHCQLGLGKLYRRTGVHEQARGHLATATTMYREMGMTYWLEKAEAEMATLGG